MIWSVIYYFRFRYFAADITLNHQKSLGAAISQRDHALHPFSRLCQPDMFALAGSAPLAQVPEDTAFAKDQL